MLRTAFAIVLVAASASVAHANVPAMARAPLAPQASATASADCAATTPHRVCLDREISRGHADLDRRLQTPSPTIATA